MADIENDTLPAPHSMESPSSAAAAPRRAGDESPLPAGVHVTHPDRVIDASTGATKADLVRYYALVGDLMMAHLRHRPVALVRAPDGVGGEMFFQKHAQIEKLPGIRQLDPALDSSHPPLLELASKDGLLSAAQWNVIELHTMNTGTRSLAHPDRLVFDLDPGDGVAWERVREAAQLLHAFLEQLGLTSFLKTSGGKGLHVVVPIEPVHDWDAAKGFAQGVVAHLAETIPQRFVAHSGPKHRVGKIFIDYLRNGLGATTVCAWSARARPGLGISVPVRWSELDALRASDQWTIRNAHARLDEGNAPWERYDAAARRLTAAIKMLGRSGP
jgi:bifunctional non-homologous end joining protein LigD